jgi:TPR repeat protein
MLRPLGEHEGEFFFVPGNIPFTEPVARASIENHQRTRGATFGLRELFTVFSAEDFRYAADPAMRQEQWRQRADRLLDEARSGNPVAMAAASHLYRYGFALQKNPEESLKWAMEAAEAEHPAGWYVLSKLFQEGLGVPKNPAAAAKYLALAYESGFAPALVDTATSRLSVAQPSARDVESSSADLERASSDGYAGAKANLAILLTGAFAAVRADPPRAFRLTQEAANEGIAPAMLNLFRMYWMGFPPATAVNLALARQWLIKAAETGYPQAQYILSVALHQTGEHASVDIGLPKDTQAALRWAGLAASQGNQDANYLLGTIYERGEGVPREPALARTHIEKAAGADHADSLARQAMWFLDGTLYARDDNQGMAKARQAADRGSATGYYLVGFCFEHVRGVNTGGFSAAEMRPHYAVDAMHWYIRASERGHEGAKKKVNEFTGRVRTELALTQSGIPYGQPLEKWPSDVLQSLRRKYPESAKAIESLLAKTAPPAPAKTGPPKPVSKLCKAYSSNDLSTLFNSHGGKLRILVAGAPNKPSSTMLALAQDLGLQNLLVVPIFLQQDDCPAEFAGVAALKNVAQAFYTGDEIELPVLRSLGVSAQDTHFDTTPTVWVFDCNAAYLGRWVGVQDKAQWLRQMGVSSTCAEFKRR